MRLTDYTDYTLRVLMFCAMHPQRSVTIGELAQSHAISKNHLMKIVNNLAREGLLQTTRGRGGGLRLLKSPAEIRIGDVVRLTETDFRMVECFNATSNACTITAHCQLKQVFWFALNSYMAELDKVTLADIAPPESPVEQAGTRPVTRIAISSITRPAARKPTLAPAKRIKVVKST